MIGHLTRSPLSLTADVMAARTRRDGAYSGCTRSRDADLEGSTPCNRGLTREARLQWPYAGIGSFAHLKHTKCLTTPSELFDIAIVGAPFDTAVSYRPGEFSAPGVCLNKVDWGGGVSRRDANRRGPRLSHAVSSRENLPRA